MSSTVVVCSYLCALTLALVLAHSTDRTCPSPCKCSQTRLEDIGDIYKVVCSEKKLQAIPSLDILKPVPLPIHLHFNENDIRSIRSLAFPPNVNIDSLDLSRNKQVIIEPMTFTNLAPSLTKLTLEAINLNFDSPLTMISGLDHLRELSISHNNRKGYVAGAVEKVMVTLLSGSVTRSLRILRMAHCGIRELNKDAFKYLTYLEELDLSNNWFHYVPEAIRSLRHLKKLILVSTKIVKITDDAFLTLSHLEWLEMSRSDIEIIEKYAFRGLEKSLKRLYLERCKLKKIPSEEIKHLKKLEYLDLTMNYFETASAHSFVGEYCLKTLLISGSNLKFERDTFSGQKDCIIDLAIKQMNLSVIPREALSKLNKLQQLSLERTEIKTLPRSAMVGIKAKTISLAENNLNYIAPGAFLGLPSRVELNLRRTKVSDIDFLLGYEDEAIATVNLDKTELQCRCSMESSLNATLNIAIFGACLKNNKTLIPFDSYMLKSVLSDACEEERSRNAISSLYKLRSQELLPLLLVLVRYLSS
ncbi:chaoptin [Biomphalaria pfeifferi]|uniref:Chaoptin n=1 Tax=Biomphalaria pfeifferi TaxID=112525 RepID=A0AAD8EWV6_BIOPF|nr:chaoptin [Biomphalaria pfeifferi]